MLWNPKSRKQWFWALLMIVVVLLCLIISRWLFK
jgi:hypothetical protein